MSISSALKAKAKASSNLANRPPQSYGTSREGRAEQSYQESPYFSQMREDISAARDPGMVQAQMANVEREQRRNINPVIQQYERRKQALGQGSELRGDQPFYERAGSQMMDTRQRTLADLLRQGREFGMQKYGQAGAGGVLGFSRRQRAAAHDAALQRRSIRARQSNAPSFGEMLGSSLAGGLGAGLTGGLTSGIGGLFGQEQKKQ